MTRSTDERATVLFELSEEQWRDFFVSLYKRTTTRERLYGGAWYPWARRIAERLATEHGVTTEAAAGIIAAMSPQQSWRRNIIDAETVLSRTGGMTFQGERQRAKAERIRDGELWHQVLTGPKETPFAATIIDRTHRRPVIDSHMADLALMILDDDSVVGTDQWRKRITSTKIRDRVEAGMQAAADWIGVLVSELQATLWGSDMKRGSYA